MRVRMPMLAAALIAAAYSTATPSPARAQISAAAPPGAAPPRQVADLASAIDQTSAVIEATIGAIAYEYSDAEGPWTRVTLTDVKSHLGAVPAKLELLQFGGPLPNGRFMVAAELTRFVKGHRYVVFLRNTAWNLSPVVGDLAFRVESVDGNEVLVNSTGQAVVGIDGRGPEVGVTLFEPTPYSGEAPVRKAGAISALAKRPLARRGFLSALQAGLDTHGLKVSGQLLARPAGAFKWRGQSAVPHGLASTDSGRAGIDTSGPRP